MWAPRQEWATVLELLLLLLPLFLAKVQDTPNQVVAVSGSNVTLKISGLSNNSKQFTWLYNSTQKIVEWESNNTKYFKSDFKDRVRLGESHELCIYNTLKEDSGTYILLEEESGVEEAHSISLKVLDPVPKPKIKIETTEKKNKSCHLKLLCVILDRSVNQPVSYTWYGDSQPFPTDVNSDVLEITVNPQNFSGSYTCQVSNAEQKE